MTRTRRWVVTGMVGVACVWLLTGTLAGQASRAEMLLQQALTKELVEQDRAAAVVLYQQVIATPGVPAGVATRARARVAALRPARTAAQATAPRVVYEDTEWNAVAVSPDGRFALGRASGTRPLMLRTLPSKNDRVLLPEMDGVGALDPVFSPDGSMVAFLWVDGAAAGQRISVGVVGTAPKAMPQRITPPVAGNVNQITVVAWATDGSAVLVRNADFERQTYPVGQMTASRLDWVSVASGATTKSIPFSPRNESPVMSPNGRHFAYERATSAPGAAAESRIYTVDSNGQNETEVVTLAGKNSSPRWTTDGSTLLFTSNRTGRTGLWAVSMQNGQAVGEPVLVHDSLPNNVRVFTAAGEVVYLWHADPARQHVFIAERGTPGSRGLRAYTGGGVSWSPDGRSIAFAKQVGATIAEGTTLIIKDVATGEERAFDRPGRLGPWQVRWSRDGASILVVARDQSLHIFDVASGQFRAIPNQEGRVRAPIADLSPDGKTVYVASRAAGGPANGVPFTDLVAVDVATGAERTLADLGALGPAGPFFGIPPAIAVSPNGQYVALQIGRADPPVVMARLVLVALDGSGSRALTEPYRFDNIPGTIAWTPDGQSVLHFIGSAQQSTWRLMRARISGGESVFDGLEYATVRNDPSLPVLDIFPPFSLTASPDGTRVAFGIDAGKVSQLVALDNVNAVIARAR